jgi:hypothetical protein
MEMGRSETGAKWTFANVYRVGLHVAKCGETPCKIKSQLLYQLSYRGNRFATGGKACHTPK